MRKKKNGIPGVPNTLQKAYGRRVRTLAQTIIALLPPAPTSPAECRCNGRGCLGCSGQHAMAFLLRKNDPSDYRKLLTRAFAVVDERAPNIEVFYPDQRWPQEKIVRNTVEMLITSDLSSNVICRGYDKWTLSSLSLKYLGTSNWCLLLTRIGDDVMVHLLKFVAVFLPYFTKNHLQVTGLAMDAFVDKFSKIKKLGSQPGRKDKDSSTMEHQALTGNCLRLSPPRVMVEVLDEMLINQDLILGQRKKRKVDTREALALDSAIPVNEANTFSGVTNYFLQGYPKKMKCGSEGREPINTAISVPLPSSSVGDSEFACSVSHEIGDKPRKRGRRPFKFQRRRKQRQINCPEKNAVDNFVSICNAKEISDVELHQSSITRLKDQTVCGGERQGSIMKLSNRTICDVATEKNVQKGHNYFSICGSTLVNVEAVTTGKVYLMHPTATELDHEIFFSPANHKNYDLTPVSSLTNEYEMEAWSEECNLRLPLMGGTPECQTEISSHRNSLSTSQVGFKQNLLLYQDSEQQHILEDQTEMVSDCFCSIMLQLPRQKAQIKRHSMFYSYISSRSIFPRRHILYKLKPNSSGVKSLIKHIFELPDKYVTAGSLAGFGNGGFCPIRSDCLYHFLEDSLKTLIRNSQRCQYSSLLNKHCAVPNFSPCCKGADGVASKGTDNVDLDPFCTDQAFWSTNMNMALYQVLDQPEIAAKEMQVCNDEFQFNGFNCGYAQVVSFLWAVCRAIIPPTLLGAPSNWRSLRRNISKFVQLRRFEDFNSKQCMHGIVTSKFPFLTKVVGSSCYCCKPRKNDLFGECTNMLLGCQKPNNVRGILKIMLIERLIFWFFSDLMVPILRASFYITESKAGNQDVFYYKKSVWKVIVDGAISSLKQKKYHLLDKRSFGSILKKRILEKRPFGFSKVRFLPKENGVRPITNLGATSTTWLLDRGNSSKSCIAAMIEKGNTISTRKRFTFKSVNSVLKDLFVVLKNIKVEHPEKLGSSVFDYNDVYRKLCAFLSDLRSWSREKQKVFIVVGDVAEAYDNIDQEKLLMVMKDVICNEKYLLRRFAQVICRKNCLMTHYHKLSANRSGSFDASKAAASIQLSPLHGVIIDQSRSIEIGRHSLHQLLREQLKHNLLQVGRDFYVQKVGISQGSILSSLLCSFYYGHLERSLIFPWIERTSCGIHKHILLRLIDDFVFMSTSREQATNFFNRMRKGFGEYNCIMNAKKFCTNFDVGHQFAITRNREYKGEDGISFVPWSGLLINSCTLEIQADYTRYWGAHMRSRIKVCTQRPICYLRDKLCDYMRPKCHPILYDSNVNSPAIVKLNAYQAFLLAAMKFHCYFSAMPKISNLGPNYCVEIIERSISYMYKLIKKQMQDIKLGSNLHPIFILRIEEVKWLGLFAYIRVLSKKQSRHKKLLLELESKFEQLRMIGSNCPHLKYAVDDAHSSMFWKIKY